MSPELDHLHFDPLNFHSPRVSGLVQGALHHVGDPLTLRQDVTQVLGAQNISASVDKVEFSYLLYLNTALF